MKLAVDYTKLHWTKRKEVREEYVRLQENKCMWCNESLDATPAQNYQINWSLFPPNFMKYPVHLQHDHSTGMTEGAVHAYCNAYMWQYKGR